MTRCHCTALCDERRAVHLRSDGSGWLRSEGQWTTSFEQYVTVRARHCEGSRTRPSSDGKDVDERRQSTAIGHRDVVVTACQHDARGFSECLNTPGWNSKECIDAGTQATPQAATREGPLGGRP
jgi:hypothetical protein